MDLELNGKVALVTGASKGIGLSTALALAREGCHVAISARGADDLKAASERIRSLGVRVICIRGDVCVPGDASRMVDETASEFGDLDILINNVGGAVGESFLEGVDGDWGATFEMNVYQLVRLIRLAVPRMRHRAAASIVNVSSISGWVPQLSGQAQYGSSKAAQIFLTEPLALELAPFGIRVNNVAPGSIHFADGSWDVFRRRNTDVFEEYVREGLPMGRLGTPEEVADVIAFLSSPRAGWINGRTISVDGLQQPISRRLSRAMFGSAKLTPAPQSS